MESGHWVVRKDIEDLRSYNSRILEGRGFDMSKSPSRVDSNVKSLDIMTALCFVRTES